MDIVALHRQGLSIKAICRQLRVGRNTVRRALRREGPPAYRRAAAPSKLDPYKDYLLSRLAEFPELSAAALCDEIRAQGYGGGISILKDFTRPYRQRRREPAVRFETPPGRQAQVDWAELGRHELRGRAARPAPVRHGPRLLPGALRRGRDRGRPWPASSPATPTPSPTSAACPPRCSTTTPRWSCSRAAPPGPATTPACSTSPAGTASRRASAGPTAPRPRARSNARSATCATASSWAGASQASRT